MSDDHPTALTERIAAARRAGTPDWIVARELGMRVVDLDDGPLDPLLSLLGRMSDEELARLANVTEAVVRRARSQRGIAPWSRPRPSERTAE